MLTFRSSTHSIERDSRANLGEQEEWSASERSVRSALIGRPTVAVIETLFGTFWIASGFIYAHLVIGEYVAFAFGAAYLAYCVRNAWRARETLHLITEKNRAIDLGNVGTGKWFRMTVVIEFGLIATVAAVLPRVGLGSQVFPIVSLVVGLHFFPLGVLFKAKRHHVVGVFMTTLTLAAILVLQPPLEDVLIGLGNGIILWVSSASVLLIIARDRRTLSARRLGVSGDGPTHARETRVPDRKPKTSRLQNYPSNHMFSEIPEER